ncbi:hypothetical protein TWF481_000292 [Arthrobotrys musiformis]|uniref:Uncharacterized protein n=1 Tax=Arthrobotrys musiformis TaxID=47236 RepID=A0AAV9WNS6_9PEZI
MVDMPFSEIPLNFDEDPTDHSDLEEEEDTGDFDSDFEGGDQTPPSSRPSSPQSSTGVRRADRPKTSKLEVVRLSHVYEALVLAELEIRELLQRKYSETMQQFRAVEHLQGEMEGRMGMLQASLREKWAQRDYFSTTNELEFMEDISLNYTTNYTFDIETKYPIRDFELDPPKVTGKWDRIRPPMVDPNNPRHFIGGLDNTETLNPPKSRLIRDSGLRTRDSNGFTLRLFGYRDEIHEGKVRTLETEVERIEEELKNIAEVATELMEERGELHKAKEKQQKLLASCLKDIQKLYRPEKLDWDFGKVRKYLSGPVIRGIVFQFGLECRIPSAVAAADLEIPGIKTVGPPIFRRLSERAEKLLSELRGSFQPKVQRFIDIPFSSIIRMPHMQKNFELSASQGGGTAENGSGEKEDEWTKARSGLRDKSNRYFENEVASNTDTATNTPSDAEATSTFIASIGGSKKYDELKKLREEATETENNLQDRFNTSLELSTDYREQFLAAYQSVTKATEFFNEVYRDIESGLESDKQALGHTALVLEDDEIEIGMYADILLNCSKPAGSAVDIYEKLLVNGNIFGY